MRYSLASYKITITAKDPSINQFFGANGQGLTIGGQGTTVGSIDLSYANPQWSMRSYKTGGYVHEKSFSRSGTVSVTLNQLAPEISIMKTVCNQFFGTDDLDGLTITLTDTFGNAIANCIDCFIEGIPDQRHGESAQDQTWSFLCGNITYN